jgi:hypothetical protein
MRRLKKGRLQTRGQQYRVLADQLAFHVNAANLGPEVLDQVRHAQETLLKAAQLLEDRMQVHKPEADVAWLWGKLT